MWHQHFPFSAVHLVGKKIWMQSQQSCVPLFPFALQLLTFGSCMVVSCDLFSSPLPYSANMSHCGWPFQIYHTSSHRQKKKISSMSLAASVLRFFSSGCPNWGTCSSPLYRNEKHRDLCAWDRSGTLLIVLLNTRAERQLCAPSCRHGPCRSQDPVGKSRFGKEQHDMCEAELSASPGWLYKGKQVFWKVTEFPHWDHHQWKGKGQAAGRKAGLETMIIPLKK